MALSLYTDLKTEQESVFKKLHEWEAPERSWTPKTRSWYVTYSLFFALIVLIAAILREYILILAVIAFAFLWFVQGSIPPQIATYTITSIGIKAFEKLFRFRNIKHFWFSEKNDLFLNLEIVEDDNPNFVKRVSLIIKPEDEKLIFDILIKYVDYGDKEEIGFNFLTQLLHGQYFDIYKYMTLEDEAKLQGSRLENIKKKFQPKKKKASK